MAEFDRFRKVVMAAIFVVAIISLNTAATTYIVFRYDDLSGDRIVERENNPARQRIWKAEKAVDELFAKYSFPYVIGIIPKAKIAGESEYVLFGLDTEKAEFIKRGVKAGRIEVAQHGLSHTNYAKAGHRPGEFRERSYVSQFNDIKEGRGILCKSCGLTSLETFIPPWNGWDENTAKAIVENNFTILSANRYWLDEIPNGLGLIPDTAQLQEAEKVIYSKNGLLDNTIMVILYHPIQIAKTAGYEDVYVGLERFEKLLQKIAANSSVEVITFQELAKKCNNLTYGRYIAATVMQRQRSFWRKLLPENKWPGEYQWPIYMNEEAYNKQIKQWRILTILFVAAVLLGGFIAGFFVKLVRPKKWRLWINAIAALLIIASILKESQTMSRGYHITSRSAIPAIFAAGYFISIIITVIKKHCTSIATGNRIGGQIWHH